MMIQKFDRHYFAPIAALVQDYQDRLFIDDKLTDQDVLLLSIFVHDHHNKSSSTPYDELKEVFLSLGRKEANFRVALSKLSKVKLVDYGKLNKIISLSLIGLKRVRDVLGQSQHTRVYVIKSGEKFSAIKVLEEFLSKEITDPEILLCDSHISDKTLFPFSILGKSLCSLKILTSNIYDSHKFNDYKARLNREFGVKIQDKINSKVHDRYLINGSHAWIIGTSLKDLGNKDSVIKQVDELHESLLDVFNIRWSEP